MLKIEPVVSADDTLHLVRSLFRDYQEELGEDLCFQSFDTEVQHPLKKYSPPTGVILIATWDDIPAGCIALQDLGDGNCEMKRLYVKPDFRKHHIGLALANEVLHRAKQIGYHTMKLDTLVRLVPAIRLYERLGFIITTAYYENPIPGVVYMQKQL